MTYMRSEEVSLLHEGGEDPAGVGQDVGEEEVGVDLVPKAPHLPAQNHHHQAEQGVI